MFFNENGFIFSKRVGSMVIKMTTEIFKAIENNDFTTVKNMIENGTDVNIKDSDGVNPLIWAIWYEHYEIANFLLEKGADINCKDVNDDDIGDWCLEQDQIKRLEFAVEKGLEVHPEKEYDNDTPILLWACRHNSVKVVKALLEKGADLTATNREYETALHIAVDSNNIEMVKLLVQYGADVNAEAILRTTPLLIAQERGYSEISDFLNANKKEGDDRCHECRVRTQSVGPYCRSCYHEEYGYVC